MAVRYSPSRKGFFDDLLYVGSAMPSDSAAVPLDRYLDLLEGQAAGQEIVPGDDGAPVLRDRVLAPLTMEARAALAQSSGLSIQCAGNPGVNGLYASDDGAVLVLQGAALYGQTHGSFPGGRTDYPVVGVDGAIRIIDTPERLIAFAGALADYATALRMVKVGASNDMPPPVTLIP